MKKSKWFLCVFFITLLFKVEGLAPKWVQNVADIPKKIIQETVNFSFLSKTENLIETNINQIKPQIHSVVNGISGAFQGIYPGTNWCGNGNIAKNIHDLGYFNKTDFCCREHDHCPISIKAQETKYGLRNPGIYTRSHCHCDLTFFRCLKAADDQISDKVGYTFFDVLKTRCFDFTSQVIGCIEWINGRCLKYAFDSKDKRLRPQWFDLPTYSV